MAGRTFIEAWSLSCDLERYLAGFLDRCLAQKLSWVGVRICWVRSMDVGI
mgnify:CR=1 FL=1